MFCERLNGKCRYIQLERDMKMKVLLGTIVCLTMCVTFSPAAEPPSGAIESGYVPAKANLEMRKWFQEARFGLFVHWGVYSVLGDGEWVMHNLKMTSAEYEKLPPQFNPTGFNAEEWVALVKRAGMRYITITSKHHDGFAMWDSKVSDWDIVDRTPYKKDVLKQLAEACSRQDIKLFFYHSHLDWHHRDYYPRGRTGMHSGRPEQGDFTGTWTTWMPRSVNCLAATMAPLPESGSTDGGISNS
jgi:alpha-L-fucosidase